MDHSQQSDIQNLRHISSVARNIQSLCPTPLSKQPCPNFRPLPTLSSQLIPSPNSISLVLESVGLPPALAKEVSDAYLKVANDLRAVCELSLRNAIEMAASTGPVGTDTIQGLIRTWSGTLSRQTNTWAEAAISRAQKLAATQSPKPAHVSKDTKKANFNHEYTPLLEKYFEYNAYPSAPDRAVLARKSMMTSRQIEVWFQNHRNRAKKDGKVLRKLTSDSLPVNLSLESLESQMPFFTIPEGERKAVKVMGLAEPEHTDEEWSSFTPRTTHQNLFTQNEITMVAPPHCFPTTYPPSCNYDPFPTKTRNHTFPSPVWMRTTDTTPPPRCNGTMDELINDFTLKLVIRDGPSKKHQESVSPAVSAKIPWFAATHTTLLPAPHPAFIRSTPRIPPSQPRIPAIIPRPHPIPSPSAQPSISMSQSHGGTTRRAIARLPKRKPIHASVAHRGTSLSNLEASCYSSSRSPASSSRVSSFSSDTPSLRRSSSSSSISSTASSTLTTPILSPSSLPENAPSPITISRIDFQITDDPFGDLQSAMSPLDDLNLIFPSHTGFHVPTIPVKEPFPFDIETPALLR